jgi:hypothetical protein
MSACSATSYDDSIAQCLQIFKLTTLRRRFAFDPLGIACNTQDDSDGHAGK